METPLNLSSTKSVNSLGGASLNVPIGGNAFITKLGSGGTETITTNTLSNWSNANSICSVYFRIGTPGSLTVQMKAKVASGNSVVKVTVNGTPFTVNLSGSNYATFNVGTVNITTAGYVKVDIQGVSRTGSYFGDVSDLIISGPAAAANVNFANDATNFYWSRRGPSVHLNFATPANTEWFYSEINVPVGQDRVGSYFMANGFGEGYFGMQVNSSTERKILFSVWNPTGAKTTSKRVGPNVVATTFDGEGDGGKSYLLYNWVAGTTYKFLTQGKPDGAGNTVYSSWFFAPEVGSWKFLVTWSRPNTTTYLTSLHSFLENFELLNGYMDRQAQYGNQWAKSSTGIWTELTTATYTGDPTAKTSREWIMPEA